MKDYFLKTSRLGFAVWTEQDLSDAAALWGNSEVTRYISADGRLSEEQIRQRLDREIDNFKTHGIQYWPVYLLESHQSIGCCGLRPYHVEEDILELGIHLKDQFWGRGYAYEACSAVIDYAFRTLAASSLFAGHNPKNTASAQLLKKLGFRYTHDEFYAPTGLQHPSYLMTKDEYMEAKKEPKQTSL